MFSLKRFYVLGITLGICSLVGYQIGTQTSASEKLVADSSSNELPEWTETEGVDLSHGLRVQKASLVSHSSSGKSGASQEVDSEAMVVLKAISEEDFGVLRKISLSDYGNNRQRDSLMVEAMRVLAQSARQTDREHAQDNLERMFEGERSQNLVGRNGQLVHLLETFGELPNSESLEVLRGALSDPTLGRVVRGAAVDSLIRLYSAGEGADSEDLGRLKQIQAQQEKDQTLDLLVSYFAELKRSRAAAPSSEREFIDASLEDVETAIEILR